MDLLADTRCLVGESPLSTTKRWASLRLTISKVQQPVSATVFTILGP